MAHVITQKCITEIYYACGAVCPADCMHLVAQLPAGYPSEGQPMVVIDPNECIDCGACLAECPIGAIIDDPDADQYWAQINANLAPSYKGQKPAPRSKEEPPRRPDNSIVN